MRILALDTSGPRAAVALCDVAEVCTVLAEAEAAMERGQAEALLPMVAEVMAKAGADWPAIDRIAVVSGPGSFTGVRIGIAAARGLALASKRPAVGIVALEALFHDLPPQDGPIAIVLDARKEQVYCAAYDANSAVLIAPAVVTIDQIATALPDSIRFLAGSGAHVAAEALNSAGREMAVVSSQRFARLTTVCRLAAARADISEKPGPLYLRAPDAKPQKQAFALR